jgi:hypothetical protein
MCRRKKIIDMFLIQNLMQELMTDLSLICTRKLKFIYRVCMAKFQKKICKRIFSTFSAEIHLQQTDSIIFFLQFFFSYDQISMEVNKIENIFERT